MNGMLPRSAMVNTPFLDFDSSESAQSFELNLEELGEVESEEH